jgi:hypothetical protein
MSAFFTEHVKPVLAGIVYAVAVTLWAGIYGEHIPHWGVFLAVMLGVHVGRSKP